ncbi:MAG: PEP-CTERM sorting domain-containing protein [Pseudomonadota bacterium]
MKKVALLIATGVLVSLIHTSAMAIPMGTFRIFNHPDGSQAPPAYGLRLDDLYGTANTQFTFDFNLTRDGVTSNMQMTYDATGIRIFGTVWGGEDVGGGSWVAGTEALYDVDFKYITADLGGGVTSTITDTADGGLVDRTDVFISPTPANGINVGTIVQTTASSLAAAGTDWDLRDRSKGDGRSFTLNDGIRGFAGTSGEGWLETSSDNGQTWVGAPCCRDWLFVIPEPGSAALLGLGLLGFANRRVRSALV